MHIKAAVVSEKSGPFAIETVELCEPRPDEVIVRVVASGMCQTDLHGRDGYFDSPYPAVYGHEGAGIVHAVGGTVRGVVQGDSVPQQFIPQLVDLIMAGKFPIERMIKFYDFADINLAARESSTGIAIKPVLRMPE
jgi:Zn-dependent alcohol dehydrogenase